jgi:glycosyltransferase involved in cell wall biosynthesis
MAGGSKVKVALVTSSLRLAGAEKQTVYMARALSEARIETVCFFLGRAGHYETALRQMEIPVRHIHRPGRPWSILVRLIKAFREFRPDLVFAPQFGDLLQGGIAGRLCGALVIGGLRSDGLQDLKLNGHRSPWMVRLAHGILANSTTGKQNLENQRVNANRIRLIPNVIDLNEFAEQSTASMSIPVPAERVIASVVGTLQPGKRVDRFVDALALARGRAPRLFGVVAGADRGCRANLEERASQAGLAPDHIAFIGEHPHIPALLVRSACLVVCSEFEGFPNTILEAMAAGVPVITTAVGDAPLIVRHNETGYVVEGGDVTRKIADYLVELALSAKTRVRFGAAGKRLAAEYDFPALEMNLLKVFGDFAAQNGRVRLLNRLQGLLRATASTASSKLWFSGEPVH